MLNRMQVSRCCCGSLEDPQPAYSRGWGYYVSFADNTMENQFELDLSADQLFGMQVTYGEPDGAGLGLNDWWAANSWYGFSNAYLNGFGMMALDFSRPNAGGTDFRIKGPVSSATLTIHTTRLHITGLPQSTSTTPPTIPSSLGMKFGAFIDKDQEQLRRGTTGAWLGAYWTLPKVEGPTVTANITTAPNQTNLHLPNPFPGRWRAEWWGDALWGNYVIPPGTEIDVTDLINPTLSLPGFNVPWPNTIPNLDTVMLFVRPTQWLPQNPAPDLTTIYYDLILGCTLEVVP